MQSKHLKYISAYSVPAFVAFSIYMRGGFSFSAFVFVFLIVPVMDLITKVDTSNMTAIEEEIAKDDPIYDYLLYLLVPVHCMILVYFLYSVSDVSLAMYEKIGMITAYGMACGLAINNAHELGHRNTKFEQSLSKLLLMTSLYMHFFIEHNRGHHLQVATDEDPASSRKGESVYAFYIRTITGSWLSAWKLEKKRLVKAGHHTVSMSNEMIIFQLIQLSLLLLIGIAIGGYVLLYFIIGAFIGIIMLETVNYIEHYGLRREKKGKRYERTLPIHSWNSSHPFGRLIMLELSRHSDHHYIANRKYQLLRHHEESPQMPTGYPGMMLLSLVPPLWFSIMHKRIDDYKYMFERNPQQESID